MENFEKDGIWFLPENPDQEVSGKLTFSSQDGALLSLIDQLIPITKTEELMSSKYYEFINGYFTNGKKVTLYKCYQRPRLQTGLQISLLDVKYVIVGHHFTSLEDMDFKKTEVKYRNLEEWVGMPNLTVNSTLNDTNTTTQKITIEQEAQDPVDLGCVNGFSIQLTDSLMHSQAIQTYNSLYSKFSQVKIQESKNIAFFANTEKNLEEVIEVIYLLQDFLILASSQITYPTKVESFIVIQEEQELPPTLMDKIAFQDFSAFDTEDEFQFVVSDLKKNHVPQISQVQKKERLSIYFKCNSNYYYLNEKKYDYFAALFRFSDIKNDPQKILSGYYNMVMAEKCKKVTDLYLGLSYLPLRYINDIFFTFAQSLEAFHRLTFEEDKFSKQIFEQAKNKMIEVLPINPENYGLEDTKKNRSYIQDFCECITHKINFINEFSLKERIEALIDYHEDCFPDTFLSSESDRKIFCRKVRDTRGSRVHLSVSTKTQNYVSQDDGLKALIKEMKILLEICLLRKIEFDPSHIKSLIQKKYNL